MENFDDYFIFVPGHQFDNQLQLSLDERGIEGLWIPKPNENHEPITYDFKENRRLMDEYIRRNKEITISEVQMLGRLLWPFGPGTDIVDWFLSYEPRGLLEKTENEVYVPTELFQ